MIWLDTNEKIKWFMNALENNELHLDNRKLTDEDSAEIRREIAEYRTMRNKTAPVEENSCKKVPAATYL